MAMSVLVLKCVAITLVVGAVAIHSPEKKKDIGEKKLRNVIITSFGEMPYDPMESGGYYQSDIIPVNFNDEVQQQTMDVALRTGILVEDPNEKKTNNKEEINDEIEETSLEDETTSTNAKRQAESGNFKVKKQSENDRDEFLSPRSRVEYKKSDYQSPTQDNPDTFLSHPLRYGYGLPPRRKSQIHYGPYPAPTSTDGDNINIEYYADLGEGWNLQDAEKILKGRNYNILVLVPGPYNDPGPHFREAPPPPYLSTGRHPFIYSFPSFQYSPGFEAQRGSSLHPLYVHHEGSRSQEAQERKSEHRDALTNLPYSGYLSKDYFSGV